MAHPTKAGDTHCRPNIKDSVDDLSLCVAHLAKLPKTLLSGHFELGHSHHASAHASCKKQARLKARWL